jgi:uncharacterized protein YicC (UPF0701 family)
MTVLDNSFLHFRHILSIMVHERLSNPMLLEALLMNQRSNGRGSSSPPPSTTTPQRTVNNHLLSEETQTPELLRSEAELLVVHELIKNLGRFKQMASLSPRQNSSSEKKLVVLCPRGSQNFSLNRKIKNKSQAPAFKVVRNMLKKKWVFIKKDKQLSDWSPVVNLLEALLPP